MNKQKQEYKLPEDDYNEDEEDYENQEEEVDEDEEEDEVSETVANKNRNSNFQDNNGYSSGNTANNGYGNVQLNPNFQFPGQNRMTNQPINNASNTNGQPLQNLNMQSRMRPQSAKTGDDQQLRFQQQIYQQQQQQQQMQSNPQWVGGVQQNYMGPDYNGQNAYQMQNSNTNGFNAPYVQGGFYQGIPQGGNLPPGLKKRPTTASRRGNNALQFGAQKKSFGSKNPSTLDLEVSKLRPRIINQDRERLYDDALKQKMAANYLKDENTRLKTKVHILEGELNKKEKLVDDLLLQQDSFQVGGPMPSNSKSSKVKLEGHLAQNLKRKIRELQILIVQRQDEIESLRRNIKSTKAVEIEVEMKMYIDECTRLRHQLEEVIKSKDTFADPEELKIIESKFAQQDTLINQLRSENSELASAYSKKEDENRQLREIFADMEKKTKKAISNGKESLKLKKHIKSQDKELKKLNIELQTQKSLNDDYRAKIEELIKKGQIQSNTQQYSSNANKTSYQPSNDMEQKRLRQEVSDKDSKIQELNGVVQQLQQKLQEKMNELSKEQHEKNKFKGLYEQYQDQVVQLEAQLEDGDKKPVNRPKTAVQPVAQPDKQQNIANQSLDNKATKDGSVQNQPQKEVSKAPPAKMIPAIDLKQANEVALEVKLKLQVKGFFYHQIHEFFFKPYNKEAQVTVKQLTDIFETNGISEKKSTTLARYIIEPKTGEKVPQSDETSASQLEIVKVLSELLGHYKLYNDANQTQKYTETLTKLFSKCKGTLKDTLQLEDYDEEGTVPLSAFNEAFDTLDLKVDKDLLDYLIYVIYQRSESIEKMNYQALFDLIEGKLTHGQLSVGSNDGTRKRPESSSPEKLKARNKEKFTAGQSQPTESDKHAKPKQQQVNDDDDEDDNYEEEFEKLLDKDDEESDSKKLNKKSDEDGDDQYDEDQQQLKEGEDEEDDDYIDEEQMLDVAERCFVRIAEAIIKKGVSVRQAFGSFIIREEIEGEEEETQAIELLSPMGFLEGIKDLGITDLEEVEVACLMRVLTKADLENAILLRELIVIMENFGIQDDDDLDQDSQLPNEDDAMPVAQQLNPTTKPQQETPPPDDNNVNKKKKKKKTDKAPMDLGLLDEKSIKIMAKLMLALMELNVSLYDFFDGIIYEQLVKTKKKQNTVEILNTKDFYELLQQRGVRKSTKEHDNLTKFLQLDPNYANLLMLKKVSKTLDEMAKNEELMAGILAAAEDDMAGGDYEGEDGLNNPQQQQQQRLITIGEDDEEKQFETNKDKQRKQQVNAQKQQPQQQQQQQQQKVPQKQQQQQQVQDEEEDEDYENDQNFDPPQEEDDPYEEPNDDYEF